MQRTASVSFLAPEQQAEALRQEAMRTTGIATATIKSADLADIGGIFIMVSTETLKRIFEELARYIMLPFAAACSILLAVLAWRQARLEKYEGFAVAKAIVETLGAVAITTAIVGALALTTAFALAGPIIFAVSFGLKSLFHAGAAIYFGIKQRNEADAGEQEKMRMKCKDAAISAIVGILGTIAIIGVMLLAKPAMAAIGIVAGALGVSAGIVKCVQLIRKGKTSAARQITTTENAYAQDQASTSKLLRDSFAAQHQFANPARLCATDNLLSTTSGNEVTQDAPDDEQNHMPVYITTEEVESLLPATPRSGRG